MISKIILLNNRDTNIYDIMSDLQCIMGTSLKVRKTREISDFKKFAFDQLNDFPVLYLNINNFLTSFLDNLE